MSLWNDLTPSKRCDWIDQMRGWAVIVMIEVHASTSGCTPGSGRTGSTTSTAWWRPASSMAAGYSLVISTFRTDGTLRPFGPHRQAPGLHPALRLPPARPGSHRRGLDGAEHPAEGAGAVQGRRAPVHRLLPADLPGPGPAGPQPEGLRLPGPGDRLCRAPGLAPSLGPRRGGRDVAAHPRPVQRQFRPGAECPLPALPLDRLPGLRRLPGRPLPAPEGGTRRGQGPDE